MILETFKVGPMECNCSIVACMETGDAVVIDPGGDVEKILSVVNQHRLKLRYALITHAHFDHVLAARDLKEKTGAKVCLHKKDIWLYRIMPIQYRLFGIKGARRPPRPDRLLNEGDQISVGKLTADVLHTPGHSPGSCCYHLSTEKVLFSGDTLFCGAIGNWQYPGGRYETLINSVLRLLKLPDDTRVIPGHMDETTIGAEKLNNPYVQPDHIARLLEEERNKPGTTKKLFLMLLHMLGIRKME